MSNFWLIAQDLLFAYCTLTAMISYCVMLVTLVGDGFDDRNVLRVVLKSLRGVIWPVYVVLKLRKY